MPSKLTSDDAAWLGLEIYLAARDGAVIRLGVLSEVYRRIYRRAPDLRKLERKHGEHSRSQ